MIVHVLELLKKNLQTVKACFFACLGVTGVFDFFTGRHASHFQGDSIPLFWAVFGLCGCLLMGLACKWISKKILARDEDYYDG